MIELPSKLSEAVQQFSKIPGIGQRTALRQALTMSNWSGDELEKFGQTVINLARMDRCTRCGFFCEEKLCDICASDRTSQGTLCIVENITDCLAIENSNQFKGTYHILGGVLNPLIGIGPDELGLDKLINRVRDEHIINVILAVNPSVEGDATCSYIKQLLPGDISVDRIGFGIPMGGSLEYLDAMTISKALENKRKM